MILTVPHSINLKTKGISIMGDKSPKANKKQETQKKSKASSADMKKTQEMAARQSAGKKK